MPIVQTTRLPDGAKFSQKRADRAVRFIEKATVHTKSSWSRRPFILSGWQKGAAWKDDSGLWRLAGIVTPLFGAVKYSPLYRRWVRRFSLAWIEVARKQGKSELAAAIALYLLIADGEESAEIYGAAADKDQAKVVFDVARDMVRLSPVLSKMLESHELEIIDSRKTILHVPSRSTYAVIAADSVGNLGGNPAGIVFDEVLAQPDERLWDYLRQGMGTRPQPMLIGLTTAGPNRASFAFREHEFSLQVADNPDLDPKRLAYIAYVSPDVDWQDELFWPDANPALFDFLDIQQLRDEATEIKNKGDLSQIGNFRIFRLNQWGQTQKRWLDVSVWDESEARTGPFDPAELTGARVVGGLDLAETTDFIAWVLTFNTPEALHILPRLWITRNAILRKHRGMMALLLQFQADGILTIVETDGYSYDDIAAQVLSDIEDFNVELIGYDQFQAPAIVGRVEDQTDVKCIKVPQTTTRMNPGSQELVRRLALRQISSNSNPLLKWMVGNTAYKTDREKNVKPSKVDSTESIDGVTALVNALVALVTVPQDAQGSIYAFTGCPECGELESVELSGGERRCVECGHRWIEEERTE